MPQYTVTVGFSPPVEVIFPFKTATDEVMFEEGLTVTEDILLNVVKFNDETGQLVPDELVAEAVK